MQRRWINLLGVTIVWAPENGEPVRIGGYPRMTVTLEEKVVRPAASPIVPEGTVVVEPDTDKVIAELQDAWDIGEVTRLADLGNVPIVLIVANNILDALQADGPPELLSCTVTPDNGSTIRIPEPPYIAFRRFRSRR